MDSMKESTGGLSASRVWRFVVFGATTLTLIGFAAYVLLADVLPFMHQMAFVGVSVLLLLVSAALLIGARGRISGALGVVMMVLLVIIVVVAVGWVRRGNQLIHKIVENNTQTHRFSVIVAKQSPLQQIEQVRGGTLQMVPSDQARAEEVQRLIGATDLQPIASYAEMARRVMYDPQRVALFNEAYRQSVEAADPRFAEQTRILKTFDFTEQGAQATVGAGRPFTLYISGIDTYGPISTVSRSDVNMLLTVNPATRRARITIVPRDSYVVIPGGGQGQKDKLTHAGIYGIESSVGAMEALLQSPIDAYVRVNFSSFIKIIDHIGGITVTNPTTFRSHDGKAFAAGDIVLNGADALSFARERKNLEDGDIDRGRNQARILEAILRKLIGSRTSLDYEGVMQVLGDSMQTNLTSQSIKQLAGQQISGGGSWSIDSYIVQGQGQTGGLPSFAMPGYRLYMYVLDESSLQRARTDIREVLK